MSDDTTRRGRTTFTAALLVVLALALPVRSEGLVCGDGALDVLEECDEGPANGAADSCCTILCTFVAADTQCRDATGECDPADVCSGTSGVCADVKRTDVCRPSAGVCDVEELCDGVASDCPADAKSAAECRPSAGVCDPAEICDGVGNACPADAFEPASVECRASAGICDTAEHCTGSAAACPSDAKSTATCRPSAGVCDVAESCDGSGDACPADGFEPASVECRASAGVCDVAESCTGSAAACPADAFEPSSVECRPSAGDCDVAETCTGSSAGCPGDVLQPDETPCDDANACSINDRCVGGICGGFLENCGNGVVDGMCAEECDDMNATPGDGCHNCQFEPCHPEPTVGCRATTVSGKGSILLLSRPNPDKKKMQWKYGPGATTPKADFGNPLASTSYQLCIWDYNAGTPRVAGGFTIPAGGMCGTQPCWKENSSGFKYSDKLHSSFGISALTLKQGLTPGKTKIILAGKGQNLPLPVMPFVQGPKVVMQLSSSDGICWEASYASPAARNQPDQFRDK
jgi:cysteine-rich repeat protein